MCICVQNSIFYKIADSTDPGLPNVSHVVLTDVHSGVQAMGVILTCNSFLISWQAAVSWGEFLTEVLDLRRNNGSRCLLMAKAAAPPQPKRAHDITRPRSLCCLFPPTWRRDYSRPSSSPIDLSIRYCTDYVKTWHPTRTSWLLFGFYSRHPSCSGTLSIA